MSTERPPIPLVASQDKYLRPTALPLGRTAGVSCDRCGSVHVVGPCPAPTAFDVDGVMQRIQGRGLKAAPGGYTEPFLRDTRAIVQAIAEQMAAERPPKLVLQAPRDINHDEVKHMSDLARQETGAWELFQNVLAECDRQIAGSLAVPEQAQHMCSNPRCPGPSAHAVR